MRVKILGVIAVLAVLGAGRPAFAHHGFGVEFDSTKCFDLKGTLTAILGRMAAYTGQEVTWEQALNSEESLMPAKLDWGDLAVAPVAMPGQTKVA